MTCKLVELTYMGSADTSKPKVFIDQRCHDTEFNL